MLTSRPKVYAGGDCVLGPSTLIESVAQGRKAAAGAMEAARRRRRHRGKAAARLGYRSAHRPRRGLQQPFASSTRSFIDPAKRNNWDEVELGFDDATARAEALRCLKCNLAAKIEDMALPPESWLALDAANVAGVHHRVRRVSVARCRQEGAGDQGRREPARRARSHARQGRDRPTSSVEDAPFFSQRENQLVQAYMQQYGSMPPGVGADEMDDLF
jgi:formate dehydrogenase beta subunit